MLELERPMVLNRRGELMFLWNAILGELSEARFGCRELY